MMVWVVGALTHNNCGKVSLVLKILGLVPEETARMSLDDNTNTVNRVQTGPLEESTHTHNDDQESNL
jgi:ABC-type lipopolysaccharide export system ATPase subunit